MVKIDLEDVDNVISELNNGELITISGRPATGKTTLVIDIMNNISKQVDNKILYFALGITPFFKNKINSDKVVIIEKVKSIDDVKIKCKKTAADGLSLVVVDYIQLVDAEDVTNNSRDLKQLALELNIPIIAINELARDLEHKPCVLNNCDKLINLSKNDNNNIIFKRIK